MRGSGNLLILLLLALLPLLLFKGGQVQDWVGQTQASFLAPPLEKAEQWANKDVTLPVGMFAGILLLSLIFLK